MIESIKSAYRYLRWKSFWSNCQLPEVTLSDIVDVQHSKPPVILDKLCLPPHNGTDDHDDVMPLLSLVDTLSPKVVLELGTAHGATVANICAISEARVYTVNALPEQMEGTLVTFALDKDEIGSVYRDNGFSDRVTQVYENTKGINLEKYLKGANVDLVIIDACHDADFVINDFFSVTRVIHPGTIVIMHDVHPSMKGHLLDSYLACMYLRKLGYNIKHISSTWWAIWTCGDTTHIANPLYKLLNALDNKLMLLIKREHTYDVLILRWLTYLYYFKIRQS